MGTPSTNMAGALASVEKALAARPKRTTWHLGKLKRPTELMLREAYLSEVRRVADELEPRFTAHEFDENYEDKRNDDDCRVLDLAQILRRHPVCTNHDSAHVVLFASPNADRALEDRSASSPRDPDNFFPFIAAQCLLYDLLDEAVRRGWHKKARHS